MRSGESDLYLDDEIRAWGERLYDFQYVPVLRPARARTGRVGAAMCTKPWRRPGRPVRARDLSLRGSPNMIRDAKQLFTGLGAQALPCMPTVHFSASVGCVGMSGREG